MSDRDDTPPPSRGGSGGGGDEPPNFPPGPYSGEGEEGRRARRLVEMRSLGSEEIGRRVRRMKSDDRLPNLTYHFLKHGIDVGVATEKDYLRLFREHLRREDLRIVSFIRRVGDQRMWYLISDATGNVAQYNESTGRQFSFFATRGAFLEHLDEWTVEVKETPEGWEVVE